jgi:hypothetical protein
MHFVFIISSFRRCRKMNVTVSALLQQRERYTVSLTQYVKILNLELGEKIYLVYCCIPAILQQYETTVLTDLIGCFCKVAKSDHRLHQMSARLQYVPCPCITWIIQSTHKTDTHMRNVFIACYSLPTRFDHCHVHHQSNLQDHNESQC